MREILEGVFTSTEIKNMIMAMQDSIIDVAVIFTGILFLINLSVTYVQGIMSKDPISWATIQPGLIRTIIIIAIINTYNPFVTAVDAVFFSIYNDVKATTTGGNIEEYVARRLGMTAKLEAGVNEEDEDSWFGMNPTAFLDNSISNVIMTSVHTIISELMAIIGIVMTLIAWAQIQVFKVIGPIAMSFAILDFWKGNWMKWFNGYVGGYGAMIVVLILGVIQDGMAYVAMNVPDASYTALLVIDIVIIGMFLSAFKFGSYIIGDDVGSAIISNSMQAVTAASTYGMATAKKGMSAAAQGATVAGATAMDASKLAQKGLLTEGLHKLKDDMVDSVTNKGQSMRDKSLFRDKE